MKPTPEEVDKAYLDWAHVVDQEINWEREDEARALKEAAHLPKELVVEEKRW